MLDRSADRSAITVTVELLRPSLSRSGSRPIEFPRGSELSLIMGTPQPLPSGWWDLTDQTAGLGYHLENLSRIQAQGLTVREIKLSVPPLRWRYSQQPLIWGCEAPAVESVPEALERVRGEIREFQLRVDRLELITESQWLSETLGIPHLR